jgi:hypothetical protein
VVKPIKAIDMLPTPGGDGKSPEGLQLLPMPVEQKAPLDETAIQSRATKHAIARLIDSSPEPGDTLFDHYAKMRKSAENIIRLGNETQLHKEAANRDLLQRSNSYAALAAGNATIPDDVRFGAQQMLQLALAENMDKVTSEATQKKYVENLQGAIASGNFDEAYLMSRLYSDGNAYISATKRLERREYMRDLIEEEIAGEENRFWLFNITDVLSYAIPFGNAMAQSGVVRDPSRVEAPNFFDKILSGEQMNQEASALYRMSDKDFYNGGAKNFVKAVTDNTSILGGLGKNNLMRSTIYDMYTRRTPSVLEANVVDAIDVALAPFAFYDAVNLFKVSRSALGMVKRAGGRHIHSGMVNQILAEADQIGIGPAAIKFGVTPEQVEDALKFSALNPLENPHDTSAAGEIITNLDRAQEAAKRLLSNPLLTERLTEEEIATAIPLMEVQTAKDFGRHVHDIRMDPIPLVTGSTVLSPVVRMGTTGKGLFETEAKAAEQAAKIGLADAKAVPVVSESGTLWAIEGRLPITESQFYVAHAPGSSTPKNFIERFLYGSRQTSADTTYGLAEVATAKRQRIVTAILKTVGPYFDALNGKERKMLKDILVRAEQDQRWYDHMEFSLLWARLSGVGDDVHEITDTAIALGNVPAPMRLDPEFLGQKAFVELKDQAEAVGKQIDDLFKASGATDEAKFWENATPETQALLDERLRLAGLIAKGPQRVNVETFLDPQTYKAQRAMEPTRPPAEGMVRMYHGGVPGEGGRWATSSLEDARGWAARNEEMIVQYVDIPADDARIFAPGEGAAEGFAPNGRFELTAGEMTTARPFREGTPNFPPEHEDLWSALDRAADDALALQARASDISKARTRKATEMTMAKEAREATPHLDRLADLFTGGKGTLLSEVSQGIVDIPNGVADVRLYSMPTEDILKKLVSEATIIKPEGAIRVNGVRVLELPGGRLFAWNGAEDLHENVFEKLNELLVKQGSPPVDKKDVNNIWIEVVQAKDKEGNVYNKANKVYVDKPTWTGEDYSWVPTGTVSFRNFTNSSNSYAVRGPEFNKRVRDAKSKANTALKDVTTNGVSTEAFREAVDNGLTLASTNKLTNANGDVLHTNRQKVMSRELEYDPSMDGRVSDKVRAAFNKMIELNNIEHLLRNEEAYLQKAIRGMQTFSFGDIKDVDGIIYRAGSVPPVPSSRIYNITDELHYVAKEDAKLKKGQGLRLTDADIRRMLKKEGYVLVKLEQPQNMPGGITVQWFIGKTNDFEVKPLKFEQIGYIAGGHRGYVDKYYGKQVRFGRQGDTNEPYLMNPHTFIVGTKAQVAEWANVMNDARGIINNTTDQERQLELLSDLLDNKPGYPSGAELQEMVKARQFDPEYPVEAVYDREVPTDHAKFKAQGWDNMADEEESGLNSYFQTQGRMYTSPKGERLRNWEGQDATIIDPFEMMNKSLGQIAGLSSLSDYKIREVEKWVKTYGQYLDTGSLPRDASPMRIFQESVFRRDMPDAQKIKNSAEAQRDTIKRVLGWRSDVDREFEFLSRQLVDMVSGGKPTKWNKKLNRSLNWALEKDPVAKARMLAFHMKMGVGNVAQFPMQITTMLAATSIDPINGMRGMFNLMPMVGYLAHSSGDEWLDMWIKLGWHRNVGFEDPADWVEMMKAAKQSGRFDIGGTHQLINYNGVEAAQGLIGKVGNLLSKGAFFFNEAERWNQAVGFTIAWHRAKKAGLVPGTAKFNEVQMKLAGDFTFNMSKAGAAAWQQGWASIPTQFLSYQARVLEALLGKQFTVGEKLRLLLGQAVLYGTAGVPFAAFLSEKIRGESGNPADIGTWEGLVDRGLIDTMIYGLTREDTQFSERAGVGGFVTDTFRELMGMSKYGQTSFVDIAGGPLYSISKSIFFGETGKPGTFWEVVRFMSAESGGDTGIPLTTSALVDLAKSITSFNNAYKAYMVWNFGQYISTSGKVTLEDMPSTDALAVFLGLTPGEYREYVAQQDWRRNRKEIVTGVANQIIELRQRKWREPDNGESIDSQMEMFKHMHPEDIWIDALVQANNVKANEAIAEGLARRYEIEKNQERMALEEKRKNR